MRVTQRPAIGGTGHVTTHADWQSRDFLTKKQTLDLSKVRSVSPKSHRGDLSTKSPRWDFSVDDATRFKSIEEFGHIVGLLKIDEPENVNKQINHGRGGGGAAAADSTSKRPWPDVIRTADPKNTDIRMRAFVRLLGRLLLGSAT